MGDVAMKLVPQEFDLRPEDLVIDERYARMWTGDEELEASKIERLAVTIDKVGQIYPALVTPNEAGDKYILVEGHRRRRAIVLVNQRRSADGGEQLALRVRVITGGDLVRKAVISNIARESYGPMELAMRAHNLRETKKWVGFKGTKKIAEYLGVDAATVTQYEKFLTMSGDTQNQLGDGVISAQSVLAMLKADVSSEEQPVVLKLAKQIQEEADTKASPRTKARRAEKEEKTGKVSNRIEIPAVKKAIQTIKGKGAKITLTKRELLDSLEVFDSPEYGFANGAVRQWVTYYVDVFSVGKGTVKAMRQKFTAMVSKAGKGTKSKADEPKAKVPKAAKTPKKKGAKKAMKKKTKTPVKSTKPTKKKK